LGTNPVPTPNGLSGPSYRRHQEDGAVEPRTAVVADPLSQCWDLAALRRTYAEVIFLADTPQLKVSGLQPADVGGGIGLRLADGTTDVKGCLLRRLADIAIAVPALVLLAPLMLAAGLAIWLVDPGPVIYRQEREGLGGRPVRVLKLRTMYRDAEQRLDALLRSDPAAREAWSRHFKLKNDPRILPVVGKVLRSSSCDEVPQLVNVILGEMSIVGPRPFPDYHLAAMSPDFRGKRCAVMPGLIGLWQISDRSNADVETQQQLDEFYIDNRSIWLDWHILFNTLAAVVRRNGAY